MEVISLADQGITLIIDYDQETITHGGDVYRYMVSRNGCSITYPNRATYWESNTGMGWDDDYDPERYIDGEILCSVLENEQEALSGPDDFPLTIQTVLCCLFLLGMGLWAVIAPESMLCLGGGWRYKNAEPTEFSITMEQIRGWFFIALAVIFFLLALFN